MDITVKKESIKDLIKQKISELERQVDLGKADLAKREATYLYSKKYVEQLESDLEHYKELLKED